MFTGTLAALGCSLVSEGIDTGWYAEVETMQVFRITVTVPDDEGVQGMSAAGRFTWLIRPGSDPPPPGEPTSPPGPGPSGPAGPTVPDESRPPGDPDAVPDATGPSAPDLIDPDLIDPDLIDPDLIDPDATGVGGPGSTAGTARTARGPLRPPSPTSSSTPPCRSP